MLITIQFSARRANSRVSSTVRTASASARAKGKKKGKRDEEEDEEEEIEVDEVGTVAYIWSMYIYWMSIEMACRSWITAVSQVCFAWTPMRGTNFRRVRSS